MERKRPMPSSAPVHRDLTLDLELLCDNLDFPEGPVWAADGSILLVEIRGGRLSRVSPDGTYSVVAHVGGGPNGLAIGPDGAAYICNNGGMAFVDLPGGLSAPIGPAADHRGGSIQRVDLSDGSVTTLYTHCDGQPLNSPNDLVFDRDGGLWFTDLGRTLPTSHDVGHVYYARPDGSRIERVRSGLHSPNGIGLSPDGARLYVAETVTSRIWCHDIVGPGKIAESDNIWVPGEVLGPLPGYQPLDSLAVDARGDICVGTLIRGGITIFAADGQGTTHIPVPDIATTNICFGGGDMRDAYITAATTGRLYRARWPVPGLALAFTV